MRYVIAGPCAIESVDSFVRFADDLVRLFEEFPSLKLVYKGSFDKANRTQKGSPRGVGIVEAEVAWFKIKQNHPELLITTDIHESWQARAVSGLVDVIQIPAMLGRQTDLIEAAAAAAPTVNCKIPVWEDNVSAYITSVASKAPLAHRWFTYRGTGTSRMLRVDFHQLIDTYENCGRPFFDITHTNAGDRHRSLRFARMASQLSDMNFFAECHPDPDSAVCDGLFQLNPRMLRSALADMAEGSSLWF